MLREVWPFVEAACAQGERVVLARLVEREGPGARPVGALMAVSSSGAWTGSISGGCVEGALLELAREVLRTSQSRLTQMSPADDRLPWEPAASCTARLGVLVTDAPPASIRAAIRQALAEDRATSVGTALQPPYAWSVGAPDPATRQDVFVETIEPRPVLVVVGATDLAAALATLAAPLGRRVVVVDPRPEFVAVGRLPEGTDVVRAWPGAWVGTAALGERDAALVVSHDARVDDDALRALLPSAVGHVAVLGSRATHAERVRRLASVPGLERLAGPAGLDLGGTSAAETALSMLAEVVAVANGRAGGRLSAGDGPISS